MQFYPWIINTFLVLSSVFVAELIRDLYHVASHIWTPLYKWHSWHHRVFRRDLSIVSTEIYQKATWYHDVPESMVMLAFGILFWSLFFVWVPSYQWATLAGLLYTLTFFFPAIARATGIPNADKLTDINHLPGAFLLVLNPHRGQPYRRVVQNSSVGAGFRGPQEQGSPDSP